VNLRFGKRVQRVYETLPLLATLRKRTPFHMSGGERQVLAFGLLLKKIREFVK